MYTQLFNLLPKPVGLFKAGVAVQTAPFSNGERKSIRSRYFIDTRSRELPHSCRCISSSYCGASNGKRTLPPLARYCPKRIRGDFGEILARDHHYQLRTKIPGGIPKRKEPHGCLVTPCVLGNILSQAKCPHGLRMDKATWYERIRRIRGRATLQKHPVQRDGPGGVGRKSGCSPFRRRKDPRGLDGG